VVLSTLQFREHLVNLLCTFSNKSWYLAGFITITYQKLADTIFNVQNVCHSRAQKL